MRDATASSSISSSVSPPADGELAGRHLLLGVTGGVAAFKACELARELQRRGATVQVAMTDAATKFIGTATFQALTGRPVYTDAWDGRIDNGMPHIDLSRGADAILVAPATADFMAKVAHGLADDLLSTLVLARDCPLLVAPAMNRQMWSAAATRRNVATLRADGVAVLGPGAGEQACGETGDGRMLEARQLVEETIAFFAPKPLAGRRVLVTAGPTFEPIDPVRGITNLSSGKMGYAIARACRHAGAEVVLVSGPTALDAPLGVRRVDVRSAREMLSAVQAELAGQDLFASRTPRRASSRRPKAVGRQPSSSRRTPTSWPRSRRCREAPTASASPPRPRTWKPTRRTSAGARACRCWSGTSARRLSGATTTSCC
jgi:phosphopantothenoylcysteine decarboxylase/phosphopantothenate--cysteine ligase